MITIAGAVNRSFVFPARRPAAFDYYCDARRTLGILPHISIIEQYSANAFRLAFQSTELGIYRVHLLCDIHVEPDRKNWTLRIRPLKDHPPIPTRVGMHSFQVQGSYASESIFTSARGETQIEYRLRLGAHLPTPFAIRFMPDRVLSGIAHSITEFRMDEIVGGFIDRSIQIYKTNNGKVL